MLILNQRTILLVCYWSKLLRHSPKPCPVTPKLHQTPPWWRQDEIIPGHSSIGIRRDPHPMWLIRTRSGHKYILVITDQLTKLMKAISMEGISTSEVTNVFVEHWVFNYGTKMGLSSRFFRNSAAFSIPRIRLQRSTTHKLMENPNDSFELFSIDSDHILKITLGIRICTPPYSRTPMRPNHKLQLWLQNSK